MATSHCELHGFRKMLLKVFITKTIVVIERFLGFFFPIQLSSRIQRKYMENIILFFAAYFESNGGNKSVREVKVL